MIASASRLIALPPSSTNAGISLLPTRPIRSSARVRDRSGDITQPDTARPSRLALTTRLLAVVAAGFRLLRLSHVAPPIDKAPMILHYPRDEVGTRALSPRDPHAPARSTCCFPDRRGAATVPLEVWRFPRVHRFQRSWRGTFIVIASHYASNWVAVLKGLLPASSWHSDLVGIQRRR
jgi:hypothetical protein